MLLERLRDYTLTHIGSVEDALDGPFVMPSRGMGLLVSLRGTQGGALPSPREVGWQRDVPPAMKQAPVHVFVRRTLPAAASTTVIGPRDTAARHVYGAGSTDTTQSALYLGTAELVRNATPTGTRYKATFTLAEPLEDALWRELVSSATAPPPPPPEEAIAQLPARHSTAQRMAALRIFVERWYGAANLAGAGTATNTAAAANTTSAVRASAGTQVTSDVPGPTVLQTFRTLVTGLPVCTHNRLTHAVDGDKLVFYVENQGVCVWATDLAGDDPPVYMRLAGDSTAPWRVEAPALSVFLLQLLITEATLAAPFGASHDGLDKGGLARVARRVRPLPLPKGQASDVQYFGHAGVIGFAIPDGRDFHVWLGAKDRVRADAIESLVAAWPDLRM